MKVTWEKVMTLFIILVMFAFFTGGTCAQAPRAEEPVHGRVCSEKYGVDAIDTLRKFLADASAETAKQFDVLLAKCDLRNNDLLLDLLSEAKNQFDQNKPEEKSREKVLRQQIDKDFQVQMLLLEKPVNERALSKLVAELFDLVQQTKKFEIEDAEKELKDLKNKFDERLKNKAKIIERRIQVLKGPDPLEWN